MIDFAFSKASLFVLSEEFLHFSIFQDSLFHTIVHGDSKDIADKEIIAEMM